MSVKIYDVENNSLALKAGIKKGETLISINGNPITDVLDYRFFETEKELSLLIASEDGNERTVEITKSMYTAIGLEFETYLMDKEASCKNGCIFCFIDQLPKGMRSSLYFKDDDHRLSFLFGNYITLTNLKEEDIDRIIKLRISPINVSVHTMNKDLRCKMMNNRFAGDTLAYLTKLSDNGIMLNCQLVLCPEVNDGDELKYSLEKLSELKGLQSVACVPVGLTKFRDDLYSLKPYNKESANEVIDIIEKYGKKEIEKDDCRKFYPSDEFYIIAGKELPPYEFYEDFAQIENGVGMYRNLEEEFLFAIEENEDKPTNRHISIITGEAIYPYMKKLLDQIALLWDNIKVELLPIKNLFFGGYIDVTGLITGSDVLTALKDKDLFDELLVPEICLKADNDIFLDDVSLIDLSQNLGVPVKKVGSTGGELLKAILNK